jgi:hypothetical protein
MNHTFKMCELFGPFLADGDLGNRFRFCEAEPALKKFSSVTFDFEGITNMTDSFSRACFETLAAQNSQSVRQKVRFQNCSDLIRSFISDAIGSGFAQARKQAA